MRRVTQPYRLGFTLIELLVVIAIIGTLASVVLASLNSARESARDAARQATAQNFKTALELYYLDNDKYPNEVWCDSSIGSCGSPGCPCSDDGWDTSSGIYQGLVGGGYMSELPKDPVNNTNYHYQYEPTNDGHQGYWFRAYLEGGGSYLVCGGSYSNSNCH